MSSKKLPAGKYYIGDPCYVICNDRWDEFCTAMWDTKDSVFDFDGYDVGVLSTKWGDGCYLASNGASLGVDAGVIGAIPEVLMTTGGYDQGTEVTFPQSFTVHDDADGLLHFGDFTVMTGDEEEDIDYSECPTCGHSS